METTKPIKPDLNRDKPLHVLRSELKAIDQLLASQGYVLWSTIMEEQESGRVAQLYQPITDANAVYNQEFVKGEMQGIRLCLSMWQLLKEALSAEIEDRVESMTEEERKQDEGREE